MMMIQYQFNERKMTQMAAFFLRKYGGQSTFMSVLKLMYFSDRAALDRWGEPISTDMACNMDNGPVLSKTYDYMKNRYCGGYWGDHIATTGRYDLELIELTDDDELSDREEQLMSEIFVEHGGKTAGQLSWYSHALPEWEDPHGSSIPIDYNKLLSILGKSEETIAMLEDLTHIPQEIGIPV